MKSRFLFFQRFASLERMRQSLCEEDGWILDINAAQTMIALAIVLNDIEYLKNYRASLTRRKDQRDFSHALRIAKQFYPELETLLD